MEAQEERNIANRGEKTQVDITAAVAGKTKWSHIIPHDIMHDILLRLPVKSLLRFKSVCKPWRFLISGPQFIKSHLMVSQKHNRNISYMHFSKDHDHEVCPRLFIHQSQRPTLFFTSIVNSNVDTLEEIIKLVKIDYPPFEFTSSWGNVMLINVVLGSCNGLLLISSKNQTFLWNPTTREYVKTSSAINIWKNCHYPYKNYVSGLGYDSSHDEYKAVMCVLNYGGPNMFIFNSRIGYWKEVDVVYDFPWSINDFVWYALGLTVNGAPHWVVTERKKAIDHYVNRTIIYFDMVEEKFKKLPTPKMPWWNDTELHYNMAVLEGCLCIVHKIRGDDQFNFWSMKEHGVTESWTKLFVIRHKAWNMVPLGLTNNGDEVLLHICKESLVTYNLKTGVEKFVISTKGNFRINLGAAYVESLVSPRCLWEEKGSHGKKKRKRTITWVKSSDVSCSSEG